MKIPTFEEFLKKPTQINEEDGGGGDGGGAPADAMSSADYVQSTVDDPGSRNAIFGLFKKYYDGFRKRGKKTKVQRRRKRRSYPMFDIQLPRGKRRSSRKIGLRFY